MGKSSGSVSCRAAATILAVLMAAPIATLRGEGTLPLRSECTWNTSSSPSPEVVWRDLSRTANEVALSATFGRRHPVRLHPPSIARQNFIDDEIFDKMDRDGVRPTRLTTDEEFLRRVTLDLTGAIPTAEQVTGFLADTRPDKRARLVDDLLVSNRFTDRWTMWFGDLVQNVRIATNTRLFSTGMLAWHLWIRDSIAKGKPYDAMVRETLSGTGDNFVVGPPNYAVRQLQPNGPPQDTYDNLATSSAQKFLGLPLECLSCHSGFFHLETVNSYLATRSREEFWQMAAFFARTRAFRQRIDATKEVHYVVSDASAGYYELNTTTGNKTPRTPRAGESSHVTPAFFLGGDVPQQGEDWRNAYGRILTSQPQFARATVNRLWKEMFHLGIVEPVDSFDLARQDADQLAEGAELQPTHPELLDSLADEFVASGYDLRAILGTIAKSSVYQLATDYTSGDWSEAWTPYFARHLPRRLQAEMLYDAMARATSAQTRVQIDGLGIIDAVMQIPDPAFPPARNPLGRLLDTFGRGNRDDTPRSWEGSVLQALSLMNDPLITTRVRATTSGSTVQTITRSTSDPAAIVEAIYLATLSRHPTAEERASAISTLTSGSLVAQTEDLQYALINTLEFMFN